jgi:hypothetical protein
MQQSMRCPLLLGAIFVSLIVLGCENKEKLFVKHKSNYGLVVIHEKPKARFLQSLGYAHPSAFDVRRNGKGTCVIFDEVYGAEALFVCPGEDVVRIHKPAPRVFFGEDRDIVAWFSDIREGVHFAEGSVIEIGINGHFDVDPTGRFFLYRSKSGSVEVARTDSPNTILLRSEENFKKLFVIKDRLFLFAYWEFGRVRKGSAPQQDGILCEEYTIGVSGLELKQKFRMERPHASAAPFNVVDMNPTSPLVLLVDASDPPLEFLTRWYVWDLRADSVVRIDREKGMPVFMRPEVFKK